MDSSSSSNRCNSRGVTITSCLGLREAHRWTRSKSSLGSWLSSIIRMRSDMGIHSDRCKTRGRCTISLYRSKKRMMYCRTLTANVDMITSSEIFTCPMDLATIKIIRISNNRSSKSTTLRGKWKWRESGREFTRRQKWTDTLRYKSRGRRKSIRNRSKGRGRCSENSRGKSNSKCGKTSKKSRKNSKKPPLLSINRSDNQFRMLPRRLLKRRWNRSRTTTKGWRSRRGSTKSWWWMITFKGSSRQWGRRRSSRSSESGTYSKRIPRKRLAIEEEQEALLLQQSCKKCIKIQNLMQE